MTELYVLKYCGTILTIADSLDKAKQIAQEEVFDGETPLYWRAASTDDVTILTSTAHCEGEDPQQFDIYFTELNERISAYDL